MMNQWPQKPPLGVPINWGHPDAKGLIGCWLFNEGSGDKVYDLSGNGETMTLTLMDPPTDWVGLWDGVGLNFDASDDRLYGDNNPLYSLNRNFSIFTSIRPNTITGTKALVSRDADEWYLRCSSGQINFLDSQYASLLTGATTLTIGKNYIVGVTISPGSTATVRVWVNGNVDGTTTITNTLNDGAAAKLTIGREWAGGVNYDSWDGDIDWVRIWNRERSANEIMREAAQPYAMFGWQRLWAVAAAAGNWLRSPFDAGLNVKNPVYDYGWQ